MAAPTPASTLPSTEARMRRSPVLATVAAAAVLGPSVAHAAGFARPNIISARGVGWGGAFTAIADDPTALHYNPAGMASQPGDTVLVGAETIVAPRTYKPLEDDGSLGETQSPADDPNFLPVLGYVTRVQQNDQPSHFAFGIGFWDTFGGSLEYEKGPDNAINSTTIALLEVVPGMAYEVNDFLQLGVAFRLGIGLFAVNSTTRPAVTRTTDVSTSGIAGGLSLGMMVKPTPTLRIGTVWRSSITVDTKGDGTIDFGQGPKPVDASLRQSWPQQAALGVHLQATPRLGVAVQADWTDWSQMHHLLIVAQAAENDEDVDFHDSYALHAGVEVGVSDAVDLRAGYTFDSNAVPDRTIERTFLDLPKHAFALGGSFVVKRWLVIDAAAEAVMSPTRHVPDNSADYLDFPARANAAPGDHNGQIYTLELAFEFKY
jgi:long-chain fatty acid transport protein